MSKKIHDMVAEIAADLGSPRVVAAIDKALAALVDLRKVAVSLHGETTLAAKAPVVITKPTAEAAPKPPIDQKIKLQGFDWRARSLAEIYCSGPSFLDLRYKTRKHYKSLQKILIEQCGDKKVADWKLQDIEQLYEGWVRTKTKSMGRSLIVMLRILIYFGADILHDSECERLGGVLHRMRFPVLKSRSERLTADHATTIRGEAHKMDRASIALAQAFQFEGKFRQKDIIGEWVPITEPGDFDVLDAGNKWLRGLRWEEIDKNLVLTHTTSKSQKKIVVDLNLAPMVIQELMLKFGAVARDKMPASGPIIVSEVSGRPWYAVEFRRNWGGRRQSWCPRRVKNMDTRAGAISEATDAKPDASGDRPKLEEANVDLSLELGRPNTLPH